MLEKAIEAARRAVERTPQQLPVLAEAGVVDAGAYGLVLILSGVVAGLRGEEGTLPEVAHHAPARLTRPHHDDSRYRYCTNFIVTGTELKARAWVPRLEEIGDSVLVVGDEATLKVHVHTDEPEAAVAACSSRRARCSSSTSPTCASRSPSARRGCRPRAPACSPLRREPGCSASSRSLEPT